MELLLDTHTFIWFVEGNARLSPTARTLIEDENNVKLFSVVSVWEMAIKTSLKKPVLAVTQPFTSQLINGLLDQYGFVLHPVTLDHVARLPASPTYHFLLIIGTRSTDS